MIAVMEGVPGCGKSYHAVKHILNYLANGGRIYTNLILKREGCEKYCLKKWGVILQWDEQVNYLTADDMPRLHMVVKGGTNDSPTLAVLDELHLYHNARDYRDADRDMLAWLSQSRHVYVDIIFLVQHRNNVDKQWLRSTAEYWRGRDLRKWVIPKIGLRWPFDQFLWTLLDQDGKTVVKSEFEPIDKAIFECYDSHQIYDGMGNNAGSGLKKVELKKKGKKMGKLKLIGFVALIVVGTVLGVRGWNGLKPKNHKPVAVLNDLQQARPAPKAYVPEMVEIQPELIAWENDHFSFAYVNGHRTEVPPALNKRGEHVYICEYAELTEEQKEKINRRLEDRMERPLSTNRINRMEDHPLKVPPMPRIGT